MGLWRVEVGREMTEMGREEGIGEETDCIYYHESIGMAVGNCYVPKAKPTE